MLESSFNSVLQSLARVFNSFGQGISSSMTKESLHQSGSNKRIEERGLSHTYTYSWGSVYCSHFSEGPSTISLETVKNR